MFSVSLFKVWMYSGINRKYKNWLPGGLFYLQYLKTQGTSLVVQWERIHLPMQGMQVRPLVRELRSHMPRSN